MRERLVEPEEKRTKLLSIHKSVNALSTTDALKLFHDDMSENSVTRSDTAESSSYKEDGNNQASNGSVLGTYYADVQSLVCESTVLKVHLE